MVKVAWESVSGVTLENCCRQQADNINFPLYCRLPEHGEHSPKHVAEVYKHNLHFFYMLLLLV
jgi:hypothetical protein